MSMPKHSILPYPYHTITATAMMEFIYEHQTNLPHEGGKRHQMGLVLLYISCALRAEYLICINTRAQTCEIGEYFSGKVLSS